MNLRLHGGSDGVSGGLEWGQASSHTKQAELMGMLWREKGREGGEVCVYVG